MIPTYTKDGKTYVLKSYEDLGLDPKVVMCKGCAFDKEGCRDAPGCTIPINGQWREVGQPLTAAEHKPEHGGYPESRMPLASDQARPTMAEHKAEYRGRARIEDPQTSKDAAEEVGGGKLADLVLVALGKNPDGLTGKEVEARINRPLNSITPRFAQLRRMGLIHGAGRRDKQIVWKLGNGVAA